MSNKSINSKIPFGKYKGSKISQLPIDYLEWMVKKLKGGDFNEYAILAAEVLESPAIEQQKSSANLDILATEFLRKHGYDEFGR